MMIESRLPLTVFKVGGSLFDLPDLPQRLTPLFYSTNYQSVVVFGGGLSVDELRRQSSDGSIDDADAHWRAIDLMSLSAAGEATRWPGMTVVKSIDELSLPIAEPVAFDVAYDLRKDAGKTLPIGWHVTSDSIAAWLAYRIGATDLVLVKSVGGPSKISIDEVHKRGCVDDYFAVIAANLVRENCRLGWVNARANPAERLELCFSSSSRVIDTNG